MPMFKETYEFTKKISTKMDNPNIPGEYKDIRAFLEKHGFYIYYCDKNIINFLKDLGEDKLILEEVSIFLNSQQWLFEREDTVYLPKGIRGIDFEKLKEIINKGSEDIKVAKIKVKQVKDVLVVSFDYDEEIVKKIKTLTARKYMSDVKAWEVQRWEIKNLIKLFGDDLDIDKNVDVNYEKSKYDFKAELSTINSERIRNFVIWALSILPDYFFHVPASSTGKYHPKYALGEGGLVRHTMAAVRIANELFNNHTVQNFTDEEKDIIRAALILHDGVKHGAEGSGYTTSTHPLDVIKWVENKYFSVDEDTLTDDVISVMEDGPWEEISDCIRTHMGEWNTDYKTKEEVLPKPETVIQSFTHLCDYLASRKMLEVNFNI